MRRLRLISIISVAALMVAFAVLNEADKRPRSQWPPVASLRQRFVLRESGPRYIRTRLCDPKGKALYLFHAYLSAEEFYSKDLEIQSGYPQGDLECRLEEISTEQEHAGEPFIILNSEESPPNDWSHRGIFWIEDMESKPSDPIWGLKRPFIFRGMTFTIRIVSFELAEPKEIPYWADPDRKRLKSATIELDVTPNLQAKNAYDSRQ